MKKNENYLKAPLKKTEEPIPTISPQALLAHLLCLCAMSLIYIFFQFPEVCGDKKGWQKL